MNTLAPIFAFLNAPSVGRAVVALAGTPRADTTSWTTVRGRLREAVTGRDGGKAGGRGGGAGGIGARWGQIRAAVVTTATAGSAASTAGAAHGGAGGVGSVGGGEEAAMRAMVGSGVGSVVWSLVGASPDISGAMLQAALRAVVPMAPLVCAVEHIAETHAANNPNWDTLTQYMRIPEMGQRDFMAECRRRGAMVTLAVYVCQRMQSVGSRGSIGGGGGGGGGGGVDPSGTDRLRLIEQIAYWLGAGDLREDRKGATFSGLGGAEDTRVVEVVPQTSFKLLLVVAVLLRSVVALRAEGLLPLKTTVNMLRQVTDHLNMLGEDKKKAGVSGFFGMGDTSPHSVEFRLAARLTAAFVRVQTSRAPAAVRLKTTDDMPTTKGGKQALAALATLAKKNKLYAGVAEHVEWGHAFVASRHHSLCDFGAFLSELATRLFPAEPWLRSAIRMLAGVEGAVVIAGGMRNVG